MNDIVIDGISINELKKTKAALQKGASKFIAEAIAEVQDIVKERIVVATDYDEAQAAAQEALELLESADAVSGASGVTYILPYYEEYGSYGSDDILSQMIDDIDRDITGRLYGADKSTVAKLYSLLQNMESTSRDWHSSMC